MSNSSTVSISIIPNSGFSTKQVLNEVYSFVDKLQDISYYDVKMNDNKFGNFYIHYDRSDHYYASNYVDCMKEFSSFNIKIDIIHEGFWDESHIYLISSDSVINLSMDESPMENDFDLEILREQES